jgi:hypothetical protein
VEVPLPEVLIYVYDESGALAALTDDSANPKTNPFTSDDFGNFAFNVAVDGVYRIDYRNGGKPVFSENVIIGIPLQFKGDPGGNVMAIGLFTIAASLPIPIGTDLVQTSGYAARGVGIARYVYDPTVDATYVSTHPAGAAFVSANARGFKLAERVLTPQMFGATGVGDETLYATNYASDVTGSPITITQQTTDGLALNAMFRWLRSLGGGSCYIPKGAYPVYGYLERIDFPCTIEGEGRGLAIIRNCAASPTNTNGYGILVLQPVTLTDITIRDITLDGQVLNRIKPTGEFRNYPLAPYGAVRLVLDRVNVVNSPIDCMATGFNSDMTVSLQAVDCLFSNAYRNTVSLVAGWNQQYTNCIFEKGGIPFGGTAPQYVLDIEPDASANTIKNITFANCAFREAINVLAGGIWAGNVRFVGCRFHAYGGPAGTGNTASQPLLINFRGGEFTLSGCDFEYTGGGYDGQLLLEPPPGSGDYAATEFVKLDGCRLNGCGIAGYSQHMIFNNVEVKNSLWPVLLGGSGIQNLKIKGMTLINVFDPTNRNAGGGAYSSFALTNQFEGRANIDAVDISVDAGEMPAAFVTLLSATTQGYGFLNGAAPGAAAEMKITNIHVSGFYRKLPTAIGKALNTTNFRDWESPNSAPADTAGQTAGPAATYYRNCTMYGDVA